MIHDATSQSAVLQTRTPKQGVPHQRTFTPCPPRSVLDMETLQLDPMMIFWLEQLNTSPPSEEFCLQRDRHRCTISRLFDAAEATRRFGMAGADAMDDDGSDGPSMPLVRWSFLSLSANTKGGVV